MISRPLGSQNCLESDYEDLDLYREAYSHLSLLEGSQPYL